MGPGHDDRYGLPDLPADWGPIVIPDDAAELAAEGAALRLERRRAARQARLRRLLGRRLAPAGRGDDQPSVGVPLIIMAVAVLTTMISLFVVTWGREATDRYNSPAASTGAAQPSPAVGAAALTELTLADAAGHQVRFGSLLPAVVLMVDGCACDRLVSDLASATPAGVSVVAVGRTAPRLTGVPANARALADPDGVLRRRLAGDDPSDNAATAVLLDARASITATIPRVDSTDDISPEQLARVLR